MTFKNIFDSGGSEAKSAEDAARSAAGRIPGARPEREGVDPELYEGIPDAVRDPKIMRETSPEALTLVNTFLAPLFKNTQSAGETQRAASESPGSTSDMASSSKDTSFKKVQVEIAERDRPKVGAEERETLQGKSEQEPPVTPPETNKPSGTEQ
ncbi:hypothetical protein [Streptomyces sp. NPDC049813]|uniref:hypothetical protein n=1 Tax=Streptomyces sp. NPDC049813 TaxID=3365597 RepID=UPI0037AA4146